MSNRILILTLNWPAADFSAAGVRLFQLIDFFKQKNYLVTIASTAEEPVNYDMVQNEGINKVKIQVNHDSFDNFVRELNPQIALFDRFATEEQFGWRVAQQTPNAIRILDTEDLHSLRASREEALKLKCDFSTERWLQHDRTKREVASIYRSDLSLIISTYEMQLLRPIVQGHESILLHLPFLMDPIDKTTMFKWPSFEEREDFMFIGFGGHSPNIDAIVFLKTKIWPLIRAQLPTAKLRIYGANLPGHIHQMHNPTQGFLVKGWAKDVQEVMLTARVVLAPLRFGAGLKGKLIDAMQYGTPSVTTSIGAEGMHGNLDWNGFIENDHDQFAQSAITLYQNPQKWRQAQHNGIEIINSLYNKTVWYKKLASKLDLLEHALSAHRNQNFIGSLLRHHTMSSTKYMAKWIEEKNRN